MKLSLSLTIISSCFFQACSTIKFEEYYPAIPNKQVILSFSADSLYNKTSYRDTLICRVRNAGTFSHAKGTDKGIVILSPNSQVQGGIKPIDFFFFEHPVHTSEDSAYITDISFTALSCSFYKGKLYMGNIVNKDQRLWQEFFQAVFPKAIKMGVNYYYKYGDATKTFTFIGKEKVEVNNKKYEDCLVLTASENFSSLKGKDTLWLAINTGVVKWVKKTGYTGILMK